MAYYLKGIGDEATKVNEIIPSLDAKINYFLAGHTAGIIKNEFYEFAGTAIDRGVIIKGGLMQAYGYFGCADTETQLNFVMPAATQYCHIYAEIDLSVVPNRFGIKATALSNSTTFSSRQDNLRTTSGGKYQLHLWQVTLTPTAVTLQDRRTMIDKPLSAVNADFGVTQEITDDSNRLATTSYVRRAISDAFNITEADITTSAGGKIGTVRRQGNFVICSGNYYGSGPGVTATIPEGFRPKNTVSLGVSGSWLAMATFPNNQVSGGTSGYVSPSGEVNIYVSSYASDYLAIVYRNASFVGGWEIEAE
jgi:hypothetical protein